jgi:hypothetical protein
VLGITGLGITVLRARCWVPGLAGAWIRTVTAFGGRGVHAGFFAVGFGHGLVTVLGAQGSVLSARCSVLSAQCSVLSARCSVLGARCSVLGARCSVLGAWCLVLGARLVVLEVRNVSRPALIPNLLLVIIWTEVGTFRGVLSS